MFSPGKGGNRRKKKKEETQKPPKEAETGKEQQEKCREKITRMEGTVSVAEEKREERER